MSPTTPAAGPWETGRQREGATCGATGRDARGEARGPCLLDPGHKERHEDRPANVIVMMTARLRKTRERIERALAEPTECERCQRATCDGECAYGS